MAHAAVVKHVASSTQARCGAPLFFPLRGDCAPFPLRRRARRPGSGRHVNLAWPARLWRGGLLRKMET
jgi:hypothetical protein